MHTTSTSIKLLGVFVLIASIHSATFPFTFETFNKDTMPVMPTELSLSIDGEKDTTKLVIDSGINYILFDGTDAGTTPVHYNGTDINTATKTIKLGLTSDKTTDVMVNIAQISGMTTWNYPKTGILGVGPQSPFWKMLFTTTAATKSSLFYVSNGDETQYAIKSMDFKSSGIMTAGRHYTKSDNTPVYWSKARLVADGIVKKFSDLTSFWFSGLTTEFHKGEKKDIEGGACLLTDNNYVFALPVEARKDFIKKANEQLCKMKAEDNTFDSVGNPTNGCLKKNSEYTIDRINPIYISAKAKTGDKDPAFTIQINPVDFTIQPPSSDDSADKKDDKFALYSVAIIDALMLERCMTNAAGDAPKLILGKLFLTKAELLVETDKDGIVQYGLNSTVEGNKVFFVTIAILGASLIAASIFSIICLNICNKNKGEEEDDQTEDEATDDYAKAK